jgi:hypothetical protein
LLIIAHGSRRGASNDEVRQLADPMRAQPGQAYDHVQAAFLELAEPGIQDGLAALVTQDRYRRVSPFPRRRHACGAGHPRGDRRIRRPPPRVNIRLTAHLGASAALPAAILGMAA